MVVSAVGTLGTQPCEKHNFQTLNQRMRRTHNTRVEMGMWTWNKLQAEEQHIERLWRPLSRQADSRVNHILNVKRQLHTINLWESQMIHFLQQSCRKSSKDKET